MCDISRPCSLPVVYIFSWILRFKTLGKEAEIKLGIYSVWKISAEEKKTSGSQISVNSVCLTSFNHVGLHVFSLGRIWQKKGASAHNVPGANQRPPRFLGTGSANDRHSEGTIHYFQTCYWGTEIVTSGLIIGALQGCRKNTAFLISWRFGTTV